MRRGIVYLGGGGHHLMDQSAALVADRIARSLQDKLKDEHPFTYRVRLEADAHRLAPDIGLDIASIEMMTDGAWTPVLDILEVKYLARFAGRFARLPALARALKALWLLLRGAIKIVRTRLARTTKSEQRASAFTPLDRIQATWLNLVVLASIGSAVYWLVVGLVAVFGVPAAFGDSDDGLFELLESLGTGKSESLWAMVAIAALFVLAVALQKTFIEALDRFAVESFAVLEYQLDDRRFLAVPNAVLDAIGFAGERGYEKIDLLSLSLGAMLASDAIFPRKARKRVWSPPLAIENWITLGYPFDLIRSSNADYFAKRSPAVVDVRRWINVVVQDDFLGTDFKEGEARGIEVIGADMPRAPNVDVGPLELERWVEQDWRDWFVPLRRAVNHRIYWDDEDARAPTCFSALVDAEAVGWTADVLATMKKT